MNKSDIYAACVAKQQTKIEELQNAIDKVQESIETARAMGQEEMDRLNQTMNVAVREMNILNQIEATKPCDSVQLGALITTDVKVIYMAVGLGKVAVGEDTIFVISSSSPIGQQLMGMEQGGEVTFAGKKEKIISIV
jgi:transcription elongation GreA/GreB family factor